MTSAMPTTSLVLVIIAVRILALIRLRQARRHHAQLGTIEADVRQAEHQLFCITASAFRAMLDEARRSPG